MDTTKTKIKNKNYKYLMPNTNSSTIQVQKRDGRLEPLDINKIHFVVEAVSYTHLTLPTKRIV